MKTTVILGAGFSKNSGIPVQSEIPELLIEYNKNDRFENAVSIVLEKFLHDIFGYCKNGSYPNLDDIFTCIDISTNSGHHLGIDYTPVCLRSIRRLLVYRVFTILEEKLSFNDEVKELIKMLGRTCRYTNYVVLNWDCVLEKYLMPADSKTEIDYCTGGEYWTSSRICTSQKVKVIKIHGSSNWLYCDNCRNLYYDSLNEISIRERAGFQKNDLGMLKSFAGVDAGADILKTKACKTCGNIISSHIATFSYRKSFRANSFPDIWSEAEKELSSSERWVFIGYSLPDADYEFKHLLKISQLKFQHIKERELKIDVVLLNSGNTISKYKKFFGNRINYICNDGISGYLKYLQAEDRTIY